MRFLHSSAFSLLWILILLGIMFLIGRKDKANPNIESNEKNKPQEDLIKDDGLIVHGQEIGLEQVQIDGMPQIQQESDIEIDRFEVIKKYKELLDMRIISQEEFEEKKRELFDD